MFRNFESVYEILRYGTFFSKNCYKVKYFFGDILFAYLMAALARLSRADPMNDAHYNVTKLNHFMYTPKRSCQEHMAEIYRWDPICCSSCFLELAHLFEVSNLPPPAPPGKIYQVSAPPSREYTMHIHADAFGSDHFAIAIKEIGRNLIAKRTWKGGFLLKKREEKQISRAWGVH